MKNTLKSRFLFLALFGVFLSLAIQAGPIRNGYIYDDCEDEKGGYECIEIQVTYVDFDSSQGWGSTSSSRTLLDRVELYLSGECTTTNGTKITDSFTLDVDSANTRFTRTWHVPKNCSYGFHARHHRSIGKDSIYRFVLSDQKSDGCHVYNIDDRKVLSGGALIQAGYINEQAACED